MHVIVCPYIDDMLIKGTNTQLIKDTNENHDKEKLWYDGYESSRYNSWNKNRKNIWRIHLTQSHYVEKVLKRFNGYDSGPTNTPI